MRKACATCGAVVAHRWVDGQPHGAHLSAKRHRVAAARDPTPTELHVLRNIRGGHRTGDGLTVGVKNRAVNAMLKARWVDVHSKLTGLGREVLKRSEKGQTDEA